MKFNYKIKSNILLNLRHEYSEKRIRLLHSCNSLTVVYFSINSYMSFAYCTGSSIGSPSMSNA